MHGSNNERFLKWGSVVLYCILIFFLSSQPALALPRFIENIDKIAHFALYTGLGWLCAQAWWSERSDQQFLGTILFALLFSTIYGASDEWHQTFVPGRCSDWRDWLVDICGGTFGGILYVGWVWLQLRMGVEAKL